jgi:hypothetical protein
VLQQDAAAKGCDETHESFRTSAGKQSVMKFPKDVNTFLTMRPDVYTDDLKPVSCWVDDNAIVSLAKELPCRNTHTSVRQSTMLAVGQGRASSSGSAAQVHQVAMNMLMNFLQGGTSSPPPKRRQLALCNGDFSAAGADSPGTESPLNGGAVRAPEFLALPPPPGSAVAPTSLPLGQGNQSSPASGAPPVSQSAKRSMADVVAEVQGATAMRNGTSKKAKNKKVLWGRWHQSHLLTRSRQRRRRQSPRPRNRRQNRRQRARQRLSPLTKRRRARSIRLVSSAATPPTQADGSRRCSLCIVSVKESGETL